VDVYATLAENDNMIHPLLDCPVYAEIQDCDTVEVNMSLAPLKPSTILKRPFLRQSSSVISVDSKSIPSRIQVNFVLAPSKLSVLCSFVAMAMRILIYFCFVKAEVADILLKDISVDF